MPPSLSLGVFAQVALTGVLCLDLSADRGILPSSSPSSSSHAPPDSSIAYYAGVFAQPSTALRAALLAVAALDMARTAFVYHWMMPAFACLASYAWLVLASVPPLAARALGAADADERLEALRGAAALRVPALWALVGSWTLTTYAQAKGAVRSEYVLIALVCGLNLQSVVLDAGALVPGAGPEALAAALANNAVHERTFVNQWLAPGIIAALGVLAVFRLAGKHRAVLDVGVFFLFVTGAPFFLYFVEPAERALAEAAPGSDPAAVVPLLQRVAAGHAALVVASLLALAMHWQVESATDALKAEELRRKKSKKRQ